MKTIYLLAGCNGAGKTTAAYACCPACWASASSGLVCRTIMTWKMSSLPKALTLKLFGSSRAQQRNA